MKKHFQNVQLFQKAFMIVFDKYTYRENFNLLSAHILFIEYFRVTIVNV